MTIHDTNAIRNTELVRIGHICGGDATRIAFLQTVLRNMQSEGDICIVAMDDDSAEIIIRNPILARTFGGAGYVQ